MYQNERMDILLQALLKEQDIRPAVNLNGMSETEKRNLLRSLMNIRMPAPIGRDLLNIQDEYLQEERKSRKIVNADDLRRIDGHLALWQGDITSLKIQAIVNAANSRMLGCFIPMHSCIDNIIHSRAGMQLRLACRQEMDRLHLQDQKTGIPIITPGYNLPAEYVIHVAGPIVYEHLDEKLKNQLAECYINVLDLCREKKIRSVAFCCISTGEFHFPNEEAAEIAIGTVRDWLKKNPDTVDLVVFNVFKAMSLS